jgi:hypothetical protein
MEVAKKLGLGISRPNPYAQADSSGKSVFIGDFVETQRFMSADVDFGWLGYRFPHIISDLLSRDFLA